MKKLFSPQEVRWGWSRCLKGFHGSSLEQSAKLFSFGTLQFRCRSASHSLWYASLFFFELLKKIFKKGDLWKFLKKITQKYKVRALAGSVSSYFPSLPHYWSCWKDEILDRLGRAILSTFCTAVFQAAVTFAITTNKWYFFLYNIHAFHNVLALKDVSLFLT